MIFKNTCTVKRCLMKKKLSIKTPHYKCKGSLWWYLHEVLLYIPLTLHVWKVFKYNLLKITASIRIICAQVYTICHLLAEWYYMYYFSSLMNYFPHTCIFQNISNNFQQLMDTVQF